MDTQLKTILAAVDFGEASARALTLAGVLAGRCGARLRVLHAEALDAPPYFTRAQMDAIEGEAHANRTRAAEFLRAFAREHTQEPFEAVVDNRTATDAILHASAGMDLVVMGTHGRRGPSRWWLGSVAERVLRETRVPLLVAHAGHRPAPEEAFAVAMLLAADGMPAPASRAIVRHIADCVQGSVVEAESDDVRSARADLGASWVAVPAPTPRDGRWLSHVGEPLVTSCKTPVLFVPEAQGGPTP
ncbi:MAG TPA: universal stress protein [Vicinamibacterales bacterium]|nr:universal stress protein [Vicinamibacterales bacterium]